MSRQHFEQHWDLRWGAEALHQVAKRSTARTRKEWTKDPTITKLAERLRSETASQTSIAGRADVVSLRVLSLEALRRLNLQEPKEQEPALQRILACIIADKWQHPAKTLSRLFWLSTSSELSGSELLPQELRGRADLLDGPDVSLVIQALTRKTAVRDVVLLGKLIGRLRTDGIHAGLSATEYPPLLIRTRRVSWIGFGCHRFGIYFFYTILILHPMCAAGDGSHVCSGRSCIWPGPGA